MVRPGDALRKPYTKVPADGPWMPVIMGQQPWFSMPAGFCVGKLRNTQMQEIHGKSMFFLIWKLSYLETPGLLIFWTHTLTDRSRQMASWHPYELRSKAGSLKILYAILHLCISQNYTKCMYKAYDVRMWKDHLTDALRYDPCIQEYDMW